MQIMVKVMGAVAVAGIAIMLLLGIGLVGIILAVVRNKSPEERKLEDDEQVACLKELAAKTKKR